MRKPANSRSPGQEAKRAVNGLSKPGGTSSIAELSGRGLGEWLLPAATTPTNAPRKTLCMLHKGGERFKTGGGHRLQGLAAGAGCGTSPIKPSPGSPPGRIRPKPSPRGNSAAACRNAANDAPLHGRAEPSSSGGSFPKSAAARTYCAVGKRRPAAQRHVRRGALIRGAK
jgi:hypothetical protein